MKKEFYIIKKKVKKKNQFSLFRDQFSIVIILLRSPIDL